MKVCFKCGESKPLTDFYRHSKMADGYLGKCKECTKQAVREHYSRTRPAQRVYEHERNQQPERRAAKRRYEQALRERHPDKYRARNMVSNAIRDGVLARQPCEVCGNPKSQAHHEDYSKPLDVRWLCFTHHREAHGQVVLPLSA